VVTWLAYSDQQDVVLGSLSEQLVLHWLLPHSAGHGGPAGHCSAELLYERELGEDQEGQQTSVLWATDISYTQYSGTSSSLFDENKNLSSNNHLINGWVIYLWKYYS
jgi:hypothetical protein